MALRFVFVTFLSYQTCSSFPHLTRLPSSLPYMYSCPIAFGPNITLRGRRGDLLLGRLGAGLALLRGLGGRRVDFALLWLPRGFRRDLLLDLRGYILRGFLGFLRLGFSLFLRLLLRELLSSLLSSRLLLYALLLSRGGVGSLRVLRKESQKFGIAKKNIEKSWILKEAGKASLARTVLDLA